MTLRDIVATSLGPEHLRLGVALSGGADSVALLHAIHSLGHYIVALHCNFHLRGDESDRDERFCRNLCRRLNIPILVEHCDVDARQRQFGESIEMAARALRYAWFEQTLHNHALDKIAVAHHREDNIETFFLRLLRGSGAKGLASMRPCRGNIIRPMLSAPKAMVTDYIESNALTYVTDSTNASDDYTRNRLRHHLLPLLEREFPGAFESIARSISILQQQAAVLESDTDRLRSTYVNPDGSVRVAALDSQEKEPADALFRLLSADGVTADMIADMIADTNTTGRRFGPYEYRRGLLLPDRGSSTPEYIFDEITITDRSQLRCVPNQLILSLDHLPVDKLRFRAPQAGDRIEPFGMRGSRLVSDILSERNIPHAARHKHPLLTCGDKILWVVGIRASRHYAIAADADLPAKALRITATVPNL